MIPYQFADGMALDLENLVGVDEIGFVNASINSHSDYSYGEYCYELIFKFATQRLRRYAHYEKKAELEAERNQLVEDWKTGTSRCLVGQPNEKKMKFYSGER